ncbi:uncharacterized protein LOC127836966 [Dreissena polymorpha]|uniref:uncharacterized protein LOC127836966 n=1 Tax=Dreissena polymorpha TaxID=45954 RepID=UPI0022644656|nr:uncharacterized protein LOC127836966 [Dreissena polymorpha]
MNLIEAVCLMVALATVAKAQMFVPCGPPVAPRPGDPPLPKLPQQFQMHVEANIANRGLTRNYKEFYDYPGNRAAIFQFDQSTGVQKHTIMNFTSGIAFDHFSNKTCRAKFINESNVFGVFGNSSQINSVNDFLYFGEQMGEVYVKENIQIRGIPVNHWTSCVKMAVNSSTTFTLDWYFSNETFSIDNVQHAVPVRAVINGTGRYPGQSSTHSFLHYYEFTDFISGPIEDEEHVFQVPVGTVCFGEKTMLEEYPPNVTRHFTTVIERAVYMDEKLQDKTTVQLYMDYSSGTFRIDHDKPRALEKDDYQFHPLMKTYDVKDGLLYIVDKVTRNCTVRKLPEMDFLQYKGAGIPPIMKYFHLNGTKMLNQGIKTWRDMPVYSWGHKNATSGEVFELLFEHISDGWVIQHGKEGLPDMPVWMQKIPQPVGFYHFIPAKDEKPSQSVFEHYVGFTNGHPSQDVFDMTLCYAPGHHYTTFYVLVMNGGQGMSLKETLMYYQSEFVAAFKHTVAHLADVSVTRIQSVTWDETLLGSLAVTVSFNLLDNNVAGFHNLNITGIPIDVARAFLTVQIQKTETSPQFVVHTEDKKTAHLMIEKGSLWESAAETTDGQKSTMKQYGPGSMAGLGIGMLIIGALLGLAGAFVIYKRFDVEVPYKTQE